MRHTRVLRRRSARAFAVVLAAVVAFGLMPGTGLGTEKELREARIELRETRAKIRERSRKLNAIQRSLNRLATEMAKNEHQIHEAEERLGELEGNVDKLEVRLAALQARLDARNREAYIQGPGAPLLYLVTASSAMDAVNRVSLLSEMNRRDAVLAAAVEEVRERLSRARAEQGRLQRARQLATQQLEIQADEMQERLRASRKLFNQLHTHKDEVLLVISKFRPFGVCPMGGPHAISDSFGIWVHRSKERGGDHVHQGVDISAASGTPILAPFDGVARAVPNDMGGKAVNVYGDWGYVYNAHLSAYGQLGEVERGDVIGYVGATGNALGPHNHFEWHPGNGDAVDPYPLLLKVCSSQPPA